MFRSRNGISEEKLFIVLSTIFNKNIENYNSENHKRYLDDCFIIWGKKWSISRKKTKNS